MTFSRRAATIGALALIAVAAIAWAAPFAIAAEPGAVSIVDKTFDPPTITVHVGDTVTWAVTKAITEPHSVTSGTGSSDPNVGKEFNSDITLRNNGDTFKHTFAAAGTFQYFCQVHPTVMTGTITVVAAGASGPPTASGAPPPSGAPAASGGPATSGGPAASGSPAPSIIPGVEDSPVPASDKIAAAGILAVAIVLLFGSAWFYRRVNRP